MNYKLEDYHDVVEELTPLLVKHYEEVALYQDRIDLDPDYEAYSALQESGILKVYTMRKDEELFGYNIFFVRTHPHYASTVWAANDVVYIDPAYRHTEHTPGFFQWCEDQLRVDGAQVITYHMKVMKSFATLMNHLDMDHAEHIYTKYIG